MHISRSSLLCLLAYGSTAVIAAPRNICNPVDNVYKLLTGPLKAQASGFCLIYLGGDRVVSRTSTRTVTGSARVTTVTLPDQTVVSTVSTTDVEQVTITSQVQQPDPTVTSTVTFTAGTRTIYQREAQPAAYAYVYLPPGLRGYAAERVSSACSCIVTPATRTAVTTKTTSVAGRLGTTTQSGATVQRTTTEVVLVTSTAEITTTIAPTGTATQEIQTTVTPILVKPKICNARGLPGANAFNYDANFNTNQANCIVSCKTDNRCLATGFYLVTDPSTGSSTGTCRKYDKSVTDSADLGPGYYNFNDKAC